MNLDVILQPSTGCQCDSDGSTGSDWGSTSIQVHGKSVYKSPPYVLTSDYDV